MKFLLVVVNDRFSLHWFEEGWAVTYAGGFCTKRIGFGWIIQGEFDNRNSWGYY